MGVHDDDILTRRFAVELARIRFQRERSTKGAMNLRGNVLEALLGSYHERMLQLGGSYDAGR